MKQRRNWNESAGWRFGKLVVLRPLPPSGVKGVKRLVACQCDCGETCEFTTSSLATGNSTSCGCKVDWLQSVGQRFERLVITKARKADGGGKTILTCLCECGKTIETNGDKLASGNTRSCGCLRTKHGLGGTDVYFIWHGMLRRCEDEKCEAYPHYGGRGIKVCDRWHDVSLFASDMGPRPSKSHSIDRKNNDGDYEPGNCRWATPTVQQRNRSNCHKLECGGENLSISEWEQRLGCSTGTIQGRLSRGWSIQRAVTTPVNK